MTEQLKKTGRRFLCINEYSTGPFTFIKDEVYDEVEPQGISKMLASVSTQSFMDNSLILKGTDNLELFVLKSSFRLVKDESDSIKRMRESQSKLIEALKSLDKKQEAEFEAKQNETKNKVTIVVTDNEETCKIGVSINGIMDYRILKEVLLDIASKLSEGYFED